MDAKTEPGQMPPKQLLVLIITGTTDLTWGREIASTLTLAPQIGLVPLGPDPDSGLFEFALYDDDTTLPERDPRGGKLVLKDDFAVVFVLLPGGRCTLGAQRTEPDGPNYEPLVASHEQPLRSEREWSPGTMPPK